MFIPLTTINFIFLYRGPSNLPNLKYHVVRLEGRDGQRRTSKRASRAQQTACLRRRGRIHLLQSCQKEEVDRAKPCPSLSRPHEVPSPSASAFPSGSGHSSASGLSSAPVHFSASYSSSTCSSASTSNRSYRKPNNARSNPDPTGRPPSQHVRRQPGQGSNA